MATPCTTPDPGLQMQANLTNYCARFNGSEGANMASNVSFTGLFRCQR